MPPKKSAFKSRGSGSPIKRLSGQTKKSDVQPTCGGSETCTCRRTQQQLDNEPKGGRYVRVEKESPAAVRQKGDSMYPKNTVFWIVHFDAAKDMWVCSDCMHPVSDHPQAAEGASPTRGRPQTRSHSSPRRDSTAPSRKNAGNQAGWKCEITGASKGVCDGCHIIPRNMGDEGLDILRKLTGDSSVADLDDPRNMLFLTKSLHCLFDNHNLSFEHVSGTTYKVHDWIGDLKKTSGDYDRATLAADRNILHWHHSICVAHHILVCSTEKHGGKGPGSSGGGGGGGGGKSDKRNNKRGSGRGGNGGNRGVGSNKTVGSKEKRNSNSGEELPKKKNSGASNMTMRNVGLHTALMRYEDGYATSTVSSWKVDPISV